MDWSELQNWDEYTKLLIGLLALTDPLGVYPVLLGLSEGFSVTEKKKIIRSSVFTYAITLLIFTYLGTYILDLFGITIAAFKIAGGILFLFYALDMIGMIELPTISGETQTARSGFLGIVPIGIPLLAGPGTISTIIIYADIHRSLAHLLLVNAVILTAALIVYFIFRTSFKMGSILGKTTTMVLNRVMGLILAAISIEFILDGIAAHFPNLMSIH